MEDLKAYIESGVLELYAMGDLDPGERLGVELMLEKYPELRTELNEIERALEKYAEQNAVQPNNALRDRILNTLDIKEEKVVDHTTSKVIPISTASPFFKYAFAASVALLLLSLYTIVNLKSQLNESNSRITALESSNQKFSSRVNYVEKQLLNTQQTLEVYQNPAEFKMVALKGLPKLPAAKMMVAFNPLKEEVMIDMASLKMPQNDNAHQYQLWALVDGKPVDLGVFDMKADNAGMVKMKSVKNAQAFAVTLEPRGGSVSPTMDQMVVMGAI